MKYNFDEIVDRRHTNALNTDGFRGYIFHDFEGKKTFPFKDDEFVRMWVADMEFAMCPAIIQAIKDRADKRIIGYSQVFEPEFSRPIIPGVKRCTAGPIRRKKSAFLWASYRHCIH